MSLFIPVKRATLLVPSGPQNDSSRKHLFIVLTDPCDDGTGTKFILMVSISTIKTGLPYDPTCILYAGDHPFVKRESFVCYQKARVEEANKLLRGVSEGLFIPQDPMQSGVFARICKGLEESRLTSAKSLNFYRRATKYF